MARDRSAMEPAELAVVLDALDDTDARAIIRGPEEPMMASEVSDTRDIPLSTTYRRLDPLTDAALPSEETQIRADGHYTTTYEVVFDEVRVALNDERDFDVAVDRPEQTSDERLADVWSRVRRET